MPLRRWGAAAYYAGSVLTLLQGTSFWRLPLLLFRRPVRIGIRGGLQFYVMSLFDSWLLKEVVLDRDYEQRRPLRARDVVIDIGAGIGDFSVVAARRARRVYAFEADPVRSGLARRNLALNRCRTVRLQQLKVASLAALLDDNQIRYCDFLKCDCEGCEYQVLGGASIATLQKVGYIAMEAHLQAPRQREQYGRLTDLLRESGFRVQEIPNPAHTYLRFLFAER